MLHAASLRDTLPRPEWCRGMPLRRCCSAAAERFCGASARAFHAPSPLLRRSAAPLAPNAPRGRIVRRCALARHRKTLPEGAFRSARSRPPRLGEALPEVALSPTPQLSRQRTRPWQNARVTSRFTAAACCRSRVMQGIGMYQQFRLAAHRLAIPPWFPRGYRAPFARGSP